MCDCSRRGFLSLAGASLVGGAFARQAGAAQADAAKFIKAAFAMKAKAIASGDQPYGAVLVMDNEIIGWGPSRVVLDNNDDAHAERVSLWDAQKCRGKKSLAGAVLYSTSIPCSHCQDFAARHGVAKMIHGRSMGDAGQPKRYGE